MAQIAVAVAHGEDPEAFIRSFDPAPDYYRERFEKAEQLAEPIQAPETAEIPPAFMIDNLKRSIADGRIYA